jgi:hypothetical protein
LVNLNAAKMRLLLCQWECFPDTDVVVHVMLRLQVFPFALADAVVAKDKSLSRALCVFAEQ